MADMMYGPTLATPEARPFTPGCSPCSTITRGCVRTRSTSPARAATVSCRALLRDPQPRRADKLYTDNGKVFLCRHLHLVCANLGIKLSHARPYAAWSKGYVAYCTSCVA